MSNIFPIKCLECNALIGDKIHEYRARVKERSSGKSDNYLYDMFNTNGEFMVGDILNDIQVTNYCCRTIFITFLSLEDMRYILKS